MPSNFLRSSLLWSPLFLLAISATARAQTSFSTRGESAERDELRLEQALAQRGSINFVATPLHDVANALSVQFHVPIVLSAKKLAEAGVDHDTPITRQLSDLPLESLLRHILDELELGLAVRSGVILITTPEDIESRLDTRVYPVLDLVTRKDAKGVPQIADADYDSLIDVISTTVAPQTWDEVGGPGSIAPLDLAGVLIVSHTRDVHLEINNVLAALRRVRAHQGIESLPAIKPSTRHAEPQLTEPARRYTSLPPQSWQVPQVYK